MNKSIYIVIIALAFYLPGGCKKQSLLTYDIPDNVYFSVGDLGNRNEDSLDVSFAFSGPDLKDSTVKIPISVSGTPKDHDRTFAISADPSSTAIAGKHYQLPAAIVVHAGLVKDSLLVKFLRTPDLQTQGVELILNISANENFHTDVKTTTNFINPADSNLSVLSFKVTISDINTGGRYWTSVFAPYFGPFSVKKVTLLNQVTGMPFNFYTTTNNLVLAAQATYYAITMSRYLKDQAAAGNTIYEADGGTPMVMGATYQ